MKIVNTIILISFFNFLNCHADTTKLLTTNKTNLITCASIKEINNIQISHLSNNTILVVKSYHKNFNTKSRRFYWNENISKNKHNGAYIIDPHKVFPHDWHNCIQKKDWFTPLGHGKGCWVSKIPAQPSIFDFGALPNTDATIEFQKLSDILNYKSQNHSESLPYKEVSLENNTFKIKKLTMREGIRFINGKFDTRNAKKNDIIFSQGNENDRVWNATQFDNIIFRTTIGAKNCTIFSFKNVRNISFTNCKAIGREDKTQIFLEINGVNFADFNKLWIGNYKKGLSLKKGVFNNNAIIGNRLYFQDNHIALELDNSVHSSSWNMCYFEQNDIAIKGKDSSGIFIFPVFDKNNIADIVDDSIQHNHFTIITDSYFSTSHILEKGKDKKYIKSKNKINFYNIINHGTIKTSQISKPGNRKSTSFKISSTENDKYGAKLQLYPYDYTGYHDNAKNKNGKTIDPASISGGVALTVERYNGGFKIVDQDGKHLWKMDWYGRLWFPNDSGYIRHMQSAPKNDPDAKSGMVFTPDGLYVIEKGKWIKK